MTPIVAVGQRDTAVAVWNAHAAATGELPTKTLVTELFRGRGIPYAWYWQIFDWKLAQPTITSMVMHWLRKTDLLFAPLRDPTADRRGKADGDLKGKLFLLAQDKAESCSFVAKLAKERSSAFPNPAAFCHELFDGALGGATCEQLESWTLIGARYGLPFESFSRKTSTLPRQWMKELPALLQFFSAAAPSDELMTIVERIVDATAVAPSYEGAPRDCRRFLAALERDNRGDSIKFVELGIAWVLGGHPANGADPNFLAARDCFVRNLSSCKLSPDRCARALAYTRLVSDQTIDRVIEALDTIPNRQAHDRAMLTALLASAGMLDVPDKVFMRRARTVTFVLHDTALLAQLGRQNVDPEDPKFAALSSSDIRAAIGSLDIEECAARGAAAALGPKLDDVSRQKVISRLCYIFLHGTRRDRESAFEKLDEMYPIDKTIFHESEIWRLPQAQLVEQAISVMKHGIELSRSLPRNRMDFRAPVVGAPSLMDRVAAEIGIDAIRTPSGVIEARGLWLDRLIPGSPGMEKEQALIELLPDLELAIEDAAYTRFLMSAGILAIIPPDHRRYYVDGMHSAILAVWNRSPSLAGTFIVPAAAIPRALHRHSDPGAISRELSKSDDPLLSLNQPAVLGGLRNVYSPAKDRVLNFTTPSEPIFRDAEGRPMLGPVLRSAESDVRREFIKRDLIASSRDIHKVTTHLSALGTLFRLSVSRAVTGALSDVDSNFSKHTGRTGTMIPAISTLYDFRKAHSALRPMSLRSRAAWNTYMAPAPRLEVNVDSLAVEINGRLVGYLPSDGDGSDPDVHDTFRDLAGDTIASNPEVTLSFGDMPRGTDSIE